MFNFFEVRNMKLTAEIEYEGAITSLDRIVRVSKSGCKLKRLCTDKMGSPMLKRVCENHPDIVELRISTSVLNKEDLYNIGEQLKQLEVLEITIEKDDHQMVRFLDELPKLKHLKLKSGDGLSGYNWLNFKIGDHSLEIIELENMAQSNDAFESWFNWFESFPKLQTISLTDCFIHNWPDFFTQIGRLKHLQSLELSNVEERVGNMANPSIKYPLKNIKVLKLSNCKISNKMLTQLLEYCLNLEGIELHKVAYVDDIANVVCAIYDKAQHFRSFSLNGDNDISEANPDDLLWYLDFKDKIDVTDVLAGIYE